MERTKYRLLHTSDLHLGCDSRASASRDHGVGNLEAVLGLAREVQADLVLIAGDMFDNPRVKPDLIARAGELLGQSGLATVILPGNHDPHLDGTLYATHGALFPDNVHIFTSASGEVRLLPNLDIQVWGRAHISYDNSSPLNPPPAWITEENSERYLWRIAMAHGHYHETVADDHRSYLIHDDHLAWADADYIALGHVERHVQVGPPGPLASYPGAPELTGGATLVDLADSAVDIRHVTFNHRP